MVQRQALCFSPSGSLQRGQNIKTQFLGHKVPCALFRTRNPFGEHWMLISRMLLHQGGKAAAAAAKSLQSCPTLCDPIDGSLPGSPVSGILQARTPAWVAISFSNAWKWKVKVKSLSRVRLLATPRTAAHQAPRPWDFPGKNTGVGCQRLGKGKEKHDTCHCSTPCFGGPFPN